MTGPTAAALVREIEVHIGVLLADPQPLVKAPDHFLTYWLWLLERLQALLVTPRGHEKPPRKERRMALVLCLALVLAGCTLGNGLYAYYQHPATWKTDTLWHGLHYAWALALAGLVLWWFWC